MLRQLCLPVWSEVLLSLDRLPEDRRYCQRVYRELPVASSHIRVIICKLECKGLISRESRGKIKHIIITEKGKLLIETLVKAKQILGE